MRRILPYFRYLQPVRYTFLVAVLLGAVNGVASGFGLPFASQKVFPILFDQAGSSDWELFIAVAALPAAVLIRGLSGYLNGYLTTFCASEVLVAIRAQMFEKVQTIPLQFFHQQQIGDIQARVMGDTAVLQRTLTSVANDLICQPLTFLSAVAALVYFCVENSKLVFVLFSLGIIPMLMLPAWYTGYHLAKKSRLVQNQLGVLYTVVQENLAAKSEVRLFNLRDAQNRHFETQQKALQTYQLQAARYEKLMMPAIEFLSVLGMTAAVVYAASLGVTLESFLPVVFAIAMMYRPLKQFGRIHNLLRAGLASLERIEMILNHEDELTDAPDPVAHRITRAEIRFRNVTFHYENEPSPALQGIDLQIPAGKVVALAGPSGSGKTTFANLIPRLFDVTEGSVEIDGIDVRRYSKQGLRAQIAVVPQEPVLFNDTWRNNIAVGRPEADDEAIIRAARNAYVDVLIDRLGVGYDARVGDRGERLSGGERQRIALARAFLKDAPIIILDEATASLDSESEAMIQKALEKLLIGRTTIIIAHRLSTLQTAEHVILLDRGKLEASGSFEQLLETNEKFRRLYAAQSSL